MRRREKTDTDTERVNAATGRWRVPLLRSLRLTRAGMVAERATRSFWPVWSWLFVIWTVLSFRLFDLLPVEMAFFAALAAAVVLAALVAMGLRRFRWPRAGDAVERLDSTLAGRPLNALMDRQELGTGDAGSEAMWQAHLDRMRARAARARAVEPDLRVSSRDPFALRYVAATGLVASLLFGSMNGWVPTAPAAGTGGVAGPVFEAWIEPPRFTGVPTIYLGGDDASDTLPVPEGSRVAVRLYGDDTVFTESLSAEGNTQPKARPGGPLEAAFTVAHGGVLRIASPHEVRRWQIDMIADALPEIELAGPVERTLSGEMSLAFDARDDYGVTGGEVTIALDLGAVERRYGLAREPEPREPVTLDLPLPFRGDRKSVSETLIEDLSKHPFAGLPVTIRLVARDAAGQQSAPATWRGTLPGRRFYDPLAAAVAEMRRDLLWHRDNARRVAQVMRAISNRPEGLFESDSAYLLYRTALRQLESETRPVLSDQARDTLADLLWQVALKIEDGNLADAEARLKRAQDRLSEALRRGAGEDEIATLTEDLRKAMRDYMAQLAQRDEGNGEDRADNGRAREITGDQLQAMLDRIEELSRQGRTDEARRLLDQLRRMMANMQVARRGRGQGAQAMQGLRDTLRQQQGLADDSFRRLQDQFNGQGGETGNSDLSGRQEALRRLLDEQRRAVPRADGEAGRKGRQSLADAERRMRAAREALKKGDLPEALDQQAEAMDALRRGLENLGRAFARDGRPGGEGEGRGLRTGNRDNARDPLGREAGTLGRFGAERDMVPGGEATSRSREVLEEIRRRSGERDRPKPERDYLDRLIDRF